MSACVSKTLLVVSSYTRFDNLAHGPLGTEAKYAMRTYELDLSNGHLTLLSINSEPGNDCLNPAFSRMHPTKNTLYACTESVEENGEIVSWNVHPQTGKLTKLGSADAHGTSTCYIILDRAMKNSLVVNYWNATIVVLPIDSMTGAVTSDVVDLHDPNKGRRMSASHTTHVNHSNNDKFAQEERQLDPHSHAAVLDPFFGQIVYVPDLGMDLIRQLIYNEETGHLVAAGEVKSGKPGDKALGPRYIDFHPSLPIAYVVNELSSEVAVFSFDMTTAKTLIDATNSKVPLDSSCESKTLNLIQNVSTLPAAFPQELNTCGRISVHNTGGYLLVSNRGHDSIAVFNIDQISGMLVGPTWHHTRGSTPRHFQFEPSGQWLIVACQDSDALVVFRFNLSTGALEYTGNTYKVPSPNFVCCFKPRTSSAHGLAVSPQRVLGVSASFGEICPAEKLAKLKKLFDIHAISADEYNNKKKVFLAQMV